jgi:HK97 family phage major capsid protein
VPDTDTKSRIKELTGVLGEKKSRLDEITAAFKIEDGGVVVSAEQRDEFRKITAECKDIRGMITDLETTADLGDFLSGGGSGSVAAADAAAAELAGRGSKSLSPLGEFKTLGEAFSASDVLAEYRERGGSSSRPFEVKARNLGRFGGSRLLEMEQKDIYTAAGGTQTAPAFGTQQNDGLIIPAYRTVRIRDLFPNAGTNANLIEYIRRTGFVNNARVVAERTAPDGSAATGLATDVFGLKPPSNLTFTPEQAPVRTIAHTIDVSKTILDDEPRLQDTINGEMLYGLRLTEDAEILAGDGTGAHVLGILNTSGIQVYHQSDYTPPAGGIPDTQVDAVRRALTRVMLAYYEPTGVVFHPFDWEQIELTKNTQGSYLVIQNVAVGAQKQVWATSVVTTPAMPQGQFLAGAFGLGAKLYDREQANIAISTETRDVFDRNAIAIRAEERVALEVGRPESFVKGFFS